MDRFVEPLQAHANSAPDAAVIKAAFNAYMEKLKQAD